MTSTLSWTSSATRSGSRSSFPSAYRYSMTMFSLRHSQARADLDGMPHAGPPERKGTHPLVSHPIRAIFPVCCASAAAPAATSTQAITESPNHFGFWILRQSSGQVLDFRLSDLKLKERIRVLLRICFSPQSKIGNRKSKMSSYDPIRPCQHPLRNRQADLFRGLQIDDQLKLRRLLDRQIRRLGAFENPIHVICGAPKLISFVG